MCYMLDATLIIIYAHGHTLTLYLYTCKLNSGKRHL